MWLSIVVFILCAIAQCKFNWAYKKYVGMKKK